MTTADQATFEAFYKDERDALALQTYALTGDLQAAQKSVRDAMTVAWHHWRKVSRLEDPRDYVRPLAWKRALRRSQTRWWGRMKGLDPELAATLDALAHLPVGQRRVLLLNTLSSLSLDDMAREAAIGRALVERELQSATAQFCLARKTDPAQIRAHLDALAPAIATVRWPRPSIITRAGTARRRSHTVIGVAAAVTALAVSGSLVTDATGVSPTLSTKGVLQPATPPPSGPVTPVTNPGAQALSADALVGLGQVDAAFDGKWSQGSTSNNTAGNGLNFGCQGARFADPDTQAALVRTFSRQEPRGKATAGQAVEVSMDEAAAKTAYKTATRWYAACSTPRVQLISTQKIKGVGDAALLFVLRDWSAATTELVAVARSGAITTTTALTTPARRAPRPPAMAKLAADAVDGICGLPSGGGCKGLGSASLVRTAPLPAATNSAMLGAVDLPPVRRIDLPWVGTEPARAKKNLAATRCDNADFNTKFVSRNKTRSFVIPGADLPAEFGLTQTIGTMPKARARAFVQQIRKRVAACRQDDLGTDVSEVLNEATAQRDLVVWRLTVEVSDERTVTYLMGVVRLGSAVSQLTFIPARSVVMGSAPFIELASRAQERLVWLGPPKA